MLQKYNDENEVDKLNIAKRKTEELKFQMIENLEQLIDDQEDIDDLIKESEDMNANTKKIFEKSRKLNKKCCF